MVPVSMPTFAEQNITCTQWPIRLYYHRHEIRDPDQEESGSGVDETTRRRTEALLPARGGSPGRWADPEELAKLLAAGRRPVPLPLELPVCGLLDVAKE